MSSHFSQTNLCASVPLCEIFLCYWVTVIIRSSASVSGLADAVERLSTVPGVASVWLDKSDIVRHPLVQAIVNAYEASEPAREPGTGAVEKAGQPNSPPAAGRPASG